MDSHKFWNNLIMYNENVMSWCGSIADIYTEDDGYDILIDECDEIIVYDDSGEWYNIYESEADDWVAGVYGMVKRYHKGFWFLFSTFES